MGIVRIISIIRKLGAPSKHPEVLACYDSQFGISNEEKDLMFVTKLVLF
jgi:hypothetical protein